MPARPRFSTSKPRRLRAQAAVGARKDGPSSVATPAYSSIAGLVGQLQGRFLMDLHNRNGISVEEVGTSRTLSSDRASTAVIGNSRRATYMVAVDDWAKRVRKRTNGVRRWVRVKPLPALGGALVTGFVAARLVTRWLCEHATRVRGLVVTSTWPHETD